MTTTWGLRVDTYSKRRLALWSCVKSAPVTMSKTPPVVKRRLTAIFVTPVAPPQISRRSIPLLSSLDG
eukprot:7639308-Pyramimonas_sp.AAC.1